MKPGQRVSVDLSDIRCSLCLACGSLTLIVPGGRCAHCSAPEAVVSPAPLSAN